MPLHYGSGMRMEFAAFNHKPFTPQYPGTSVSAICEQIDVEKPIGSRILHVVVMPAAQPGWSMVLNRNGIIAVLIGLLLPAVQKVLDGTSGDRSELRSLLSDGGRLGVVRSTVFDYESIEPL